ncbi:MAG: hypothetical protein SFX74_04410 [Fimbriimonadaceae bacterium]|nr:hypothetical protein [Fimbriimonadaceae bacterium]
MQPQGDYPRMAPTPKKSKTGLIIGLVIGGVVLCCVLPIGFLVGAGFWAMNAGAGMVGCQISVSSAAEALRAYTQENGGKLPPAKTWRQAMAPFLEKELGAAAEKDNPLAKSVWKPGEAWGCNESSMQTGFAFNEEFAGKSIQDIKNQAEAVVLFEVPERKDNAVFKYKPLDFTKSPRIQLGTINEPRGWYIITADGEAGAIGKNGKIRRVSGTTSSS